MFAPRVSAGALDTVWPVPPPGQLAFDGFASSDSGVAVRRFSSLYGVHAYHTKVPAEAIVGFIEAHSQPGDTVVDPFCGSGMTGVAAAMVGRNAVLNDLSPAAVHIAHNYTAPCDPRLFEMAVDRVLAEAGQRVEDLYATHHDGRDARVEYIVWSDARRCPGCGNEIVLWDVRDAGLRTITCPDCEATTAKTDMPVVGEKAVEVNLSAGGPHRVTRPATDEDLGPAVTLEALPWFPRTPFDASRPMWRRGHADLGITTVAGFYSHRNLAAMSLLWDAASRETDPRVREALRFSLTAIANRASRRYQWNAKRPTNVLGGTLYISSLRYEWNVLSLWPRKTRAIAKLLASQIAEPGQVTVLNGSATSLAIADESIDYCFTDPPFGAHIVYSDASLLWESWLDDLTDRASEAIIVRGGDQGKSIDDYGALLRESFREVRRVLKPTGRATVVFQASDPGTWSAVYQAAIDAGLHFADATTLDKGQPSFKQVKGRHAGELVAETDVVLTFSRQPLPTRSVEVIDVDQAVRRAFDAASNAQRRATAGAIFGDVNARLLRAGARPVGIRDVHASLERQVMVAA